MYLISLRSLFYVICHVVAFALFSLFLFLSLWHAFFGSQNIYMGAGRRKFTRTHTKNTKNIYCACVGKAHAHILRFMPLCFRLLLRYSTCTFSNLLAEDLDAH